MNGTGTADDQSVVDEVFSDSLREKFELYSYRGAATLLAQNHPGHLSEIVERLERFEIDTTMIRLPGGNKGLVAKYVDHLFAGTDWKECRITADLHVKLLHAKKDDEILREYIREGYLDGHRIDFVNGRVALDLEWNSKDQTYDRDLYAFSAFHAAGAIDVGILLTRGTGLHMDFMHSLGKVLNKDGTEGTKDVADKFGASTTYMPKLRYRLDAGRNGGCPVLAVGITPQCVTDYHEPKEERP